MSTILTAAGESLIARLQAEGKALIIDTMILANVPGQDHTQAIAPGVTVPAEAQIALRYAIPPQYRAYVNPNQVVYSAMLGSDMGDFTFNWQGLWCSEHNTLVAVATFPALEKRRYDEANGKTGNNLTRNFLLTFTGARELTGLTISADVWQLDFTVRLNGIDERQRLANFDIYGQAFFDADGWLLQKTAEAYAFAPGLGYVGGIRAALAESLPLAAPESANLPQNVWLDVCLKHTGSDRVAEASPMLAPPAAPLADSAADETGLMHYRALVARIEADGSVTDLRPRKTSGALPIPDIATPEVAGTMRPDGVTCYLQGDLLKIFLATLEKHGLVMPDGKTIGISPDKKITAISAIYKNTGDCDLFDPGFYICDNTADKMLHAPVAGVFVLWKKGLKSGDTWLIYDHAVSFEGFVHTWHRAFVPSRGTWSGWDDKICIPAYSKVCRASDVIGGRLAIQAPAGQDNVSLWSKNGVLMVARNGGDTTNEYESLALDPKNGTISGVLPAPRPTAANFVTCGATLPAGGTWAYCLSCWNATGYYIQTYSGVAAGGSVVAAGANYINGFAWRVA